MESVKDLTVGGIVPEENWPNPLNETWVVAPELLVINEERARSYVDKYLRGVSAYVFVDTNLSVKVEEYRAWKSRGRDPLWEMLGCITEALALIRVQDPDGKKLLEGFTPAERRRYSKSSPASLLVRLQINSNRETIRNLADAASELAARGLFGGGVYDARNSGETTASLKAAYRARRKPHIEVVEKPVGEELSGERHDQEQASSASNCSESKSSPVNEVRTPENSTEPLVVPEPDDEPQEFSVQITGRPKISISAAESEALKEPANRDGMASLPLTTILEWSSEEHMHRFNAGQPGQRMMLTVIQAGNGRARVLDLRLVPVKEVVLMRHASKPVR